jgi:ATP synthase protein I
MSTLHKSLQTEVFRITFYQLIIIMGFTLLLFWLKGIQSGLSTLVGGLSHWLPTCIFMWRVSAHAGVRAVNRFMVAFFAGEVVKLILTGILFLIAVRYLHISLLPAVVGLVASIVAFWIASVVCLYKVGAK